jgi:hypothetical protein
LTPLGKIGRRSRAIAAVGLASALAACSGFSVSDINVPKFDFNPLATNAPVMGLGNPTAPVTPDQLVGADGSCATGAESAGAGVSLSMTECEVVGRLGVPENVEVSANERGQRAVSLTYIRNARPGIYRFVGGRLTVIDRAPEPPAPPKPVKVKKTPKKIVKKRPVSQQQPPPSPSPPPPPNSVWPPPPR